jgi:hypothetical protein
MSDDSFYRQREYYARLDTENERQRPFYLLRPRVCLDGSQWCALYGDDIMSGVAGFGNTPAAAAAAFDDAFYGYDKIKEPKKGAST